MIERLDYVAINGPAIAAMAAAKKRMSSIEPGIRALIELRVSQINGCAYCIDLHSKEAIDAGEDEARVAHLADWQDAPHFTSAEKAALAWAEAVTLLPETGADDATYEALAMHHNETEIVDITLIIAQMNAWNRLAVSFRHEPD